MSRRVTKPTYRWNIELDTQAICYADGAAVESYLEVGDNRRGYTNGAEFPAMYPGHVKGAVPAMERARITLKRQLPEAIVARLAEVAVGLAYAKADSHCA